MTIYMRSRDLEETNSLVMWQIKYNILVADPTLLLSKWDYRTVILHWSAVKRILRYIRGFIHHGLTIYSNSSPSLHAYSDADWEGSLDDRRSTSIFCIYLGQNLISCSAKKQLTVSHSNTEAKYRSLAVTCTEILWLQFLLHEIHVSLDSPPTL